MGKREGIDLFPEGVPIPFRHCSCLFPIPCSLCCFVPMHHTPRYVRAETNGGWPIAGLVTLLTVILIIGVTIIHKRTYRHPTDPLNHAVGGAKPQPAAAAPAATH